MTVLLLNAGSSSLKFTLMDGDAAVQAGGAADWSGAVTHYEFTGLDGAKRREDVPWRGTGEATRRAIADLLRGGLDRTQLVAVGHRWVHGGDFTGSVRVTAQVQAKLEALSDLAPLHNPPSLDALRAAQDALPGVAHVAAFDTAFHANLSPVARTYALPRKWTDEWGLRRYGFHGLSYAWCAERAAQMLGGRSDLRLVVCHLGQGCSAAAIRGGQSVDTTMGFTPLDGLVMATRSGSVDPGLVLHAMRHHGLTPDQVESILNRDSGLLGISGISGDMREVLTATHAGDEQAHLAVTVYCQRIRQSIGALATTMAGLDAVVFTGGVGEHASEVRQVACGGLEYLGLQLDQGTNAACRPDADVARVNSPVRVLVIAAREDVVLFREVKRVIGV